MSYHAMTETKSKPLVRDRMRRHLHRGAGRAPRASGRHSRHILSGGASRGAVDMGHLPKLAFGGSSGGCVSVVGHDLRGVQADARYGQCHLRCCIRVFPPSWAGKPGSSGDGPPGCESWTAAVLTGIRSCSHPGVEDGTCRGNSWSCGSCRVTMAFSLARGGGAMTGEGDAGAPAALLGTGDEQVGGRQGTGRESRALPPAPGPRTRSRCCWRPPSRPRSRGGCAQVRTSGASVLRSCAWTTFSAASPPSSSREPLPGEEERGGTAGSPAPLRAHPDGAA